MSNEEREDGSEWAFLHGATTLKDQFQKICEKAGPLATTACVELWPLVRKWMQATIEEDTEIEEMDDGELYASIPDDMWE